MGKGQSCASRLCAAQRPLHLLLAMQALSQAVSGPAAAAPAAAAVTAVAANPITATLEDVLRVGAGAALPRATGAACTGAARTAATGIAITPDMATEQNRSKSKQCVLAKRCCACDVGS